MIPHGWYWYHMVGYGNITLLYMQNKNSAGICFPLVLKIFWRTFCWYTWIKMASTGKVWCSAFLIVMLLRLMEIKNQNMEQRCWILSLIYMLVIRELLVLYQQIYAQIPYAMWTVWVPPIDKGPSFFMIRMILLR